MLAAVEFNAVYVVMFPLSARNLQFGHVELSRTPAFVRALIAAKAESFTGI
ncbi:hypothetical protein [Henriciella barbarensis]|uniref:hypothetical protein n=1 Tax=Henriciella barbarensis TaxID=86342 RepID=UPI0015FDC7EA|nr:hypothetical protein [Henriciella barbarensis]